MFNFSIIIPVYNEEESIKILLEEILLINFNYEYEIIIINDCSLDKTSSILEKFKYKNIRIFSHSKRMGQSRSIHDGIVKAKYDTVVTIDGDCQNNPKDIIKLIEKYQFKENVKLVSGIRLKRRDKFIKIISSKIANSIRRFYLNDDCKDTGCSLKIFSKEIFLKIPYFNGIHRFIPSLFIGIGHEVLYENVDHRPRLHGKTKYGISNRLFRGLVDMYKVKRIIKMINND